MPVTTYPASHKADVYSHQSWIPKNTSALELLHRSCPGEAQRCKNDHLIQTSFPHVINSDTTNEVIFPEGNGFVKAAISAYSNHRHLVLRPDDVWLAVLTQLSLYINANAENLRGSFVEHQGQKELEIWEIGTIDSVDFGVVADKMGLEIEKNVVDPELRAWVMPSFSTTTPQDCIVASIVFMGAMQKYFTYKCSMLCGLPSVTLQGERADWQKLLDRLEKLPSLGKEAERWHSLLVPVFQRFLRTFDAPESNEVKSFWQKIAHYIEGGSGPSYYSGWITAFCFWDDDGKCVYHKGWNMVSLGDAEYHHIESDEIPCGFASVPLTVDDDGRIYNTRMVAGSVAKRLTSSGKESADGTIGLDTLEPVSGWWMFEVMT